MKYFRNHYSADHQYAPSDPDARRGLAALQSFDGDVGIDRELERKSEGQAKRGGDKRCRRFAASGLEVRDQYR